MNDESAQHNDGSKIAWVKPELIDLQQDTSEVNAGFDIGTDGDGGLTTSMS